MTALKLEPGDVFLTTLPGSGLSSMIIRAERRMSPDKQARYSHAAHVAIDGKRLFDTRWRVRYSELSEYIGQPCSIYRPAIKKAYIWEGLIRTNYDLGMRYPWPRLFLHLFSLADNMHWHRLVCSERVAKYLNFVFRKSGNYDFAHYYGWTPDDIDDYCLGHWEFFERVYEGEVPDGI